MTTVLKEIIATGKDIEDAKETARMILGVTDADEVKYEVLEAGSRGILGIIGVKPAKVKATIDTGEPEPKKERKSHEDKVEETGDEPRRNRDRRNRNRRGGKKREKFEIPEMPEDFDDNKIKPKKRFWLFSHSSENLTLKQKTVYFSFNVSPPFM